jgi:hypothetical protein
MVRPSATVEKVAMPLFRGGLHESFVSISCEIVGEAFVSSVISEVHAPGNDGILLFSAAFGRRNSLQEGLFDKLRRARLMVRPSVFFQCPEGSFLRSLHNLICAPLSGHDFRKP